MYSSSHRDQLNVTVVAPFKYGQLTTDANILFDEGAQRSLGREIIVKTIMS